MSENATSNELKQFIINWSNVQIKETKHNHIKMLIDGHSFLMFFKYENKIYGTTEENRVAFSKMKEPDEEYPENWAKEANFVAFNLSQGLLGKPIQEIFYLDDLKKIKIIDKEEAYKELEKVAEKVDVQKVTSGTNAILKYLKRKKNN